MFVGERLLRDSDTASMAVSLELRVPLLDHRVVEAAQRVPERLRFANLGKKQLLRTLALSNIDKNIFDRPKAGFVRLIFPVVGPVTYSNDFGAHFVTAPRACTGLACGHPTFFCAGAARTESVSDSGVTPRSEARLELQEVLLESVITNKRDNDCCASS